MSASNLATQPSHSNSSTGNSIRDKALELLGMGFEQTHVASALTVSEGRISQLLTDESFIKELTELKYKQLAKHNETDNLYDSIEKKLAQKLDQCVPLLFKPTEIARTLHLVNGFKRRGASSPESLTRSKPTIRLNIPIAVVNKFQLNAAGQVVSAGISINDSEGIHSQDLVTIQSGNMDRLVNEHAKNQPQPEYFPSGRPTQPKRLTEEQFKESDGVRHRKAQGREFHDVLEECGFTVELTTESPPEKS